MTDQQSDPPQIVDDQIAYYRLRAGEYDETAYGSLPSARERISRIVATLPQGSRTLELACGTGVWTEALSARTDDLTAIDSSPEALEIARPRCPDTVRFVCADVLRSIPAGRYDLIFFAFWLSHVPSACWPEFFGRLHRSLAPSGRLVFVDEHVSQAVHEKATDDPEIVERNLNDGSTHRLVKVFVDPAQAAARLAELGWECDIVRDGTDWVVGTAVKGVVS